MSRKVALIVFGVLLLGLLIIWFIRRPDARLEIGGNDRFGLGFIDGPNHPADETRYLGALATGARWDRWPLYWDWVEAGGGYAGVRGDEAYDYDALVTQEFAHGLTPVVILMGTPAKYATTDANAATDPSPQQQLLSGSLLTTTNTSTLPPDHLNEPIFTDGTDEPGPGKTINPENVWAFFVYTSVERYRPQGELAGQQGWPDDVGVRYWEVWNEPDYHNFWRGTVEEYYRLLEVAYKTIKFADPEAVVLLGGLAFYDQPSWFQDLLILTAGQPNRAYFDIFSYHHYLSIYDSEQQLKQVRTTLAAYNLAEIPIWVTESGVSVWDDYPATQYDVSPYAPHRGSMVEQAAYIIQHSALAFYNGVERYYHFMLHDDCGDGPSSAYGLRQNFSPHSCNPATGQPRPAYAAYQLATEQFRELHPLWRKQQLDQDQVAFYRPDDQSRLTVLWATQGMTATAFLTATGPTAQVHWVETTETLSGTVGISRSRILTPTNGIYTLTLGPATNRNGSRANNLTYQIGGLPLIVVEQDNQPPQTFIQPLPSTSPPGFLVKWHGEDSGSGIAGYDVYVSQDDAPPEIWLENTLQTEARYNGAVDHNYSFSVTTRDQAGNEAALSAQLQVSTRIISGLAISGRVVDAGGEPVARANVTIFGPNTEETALTNDDGLWPPVPLLPGEYTVQASAAGYNTWNSAHRVEINNAPLTITTSLAPASNAVTAGDLEGNQVWNIWDWEGQINLTTQAFDGQSAVRLGEGSGQVAPCPDGQDGQMWLLRQAVTIPSDPAPVLSFMYHISAPQTVPNQAWLEVLLHIDDQPYFVFAPHELQPAADWALAYQNLSAWQGESAELLFKLQNCAEQAYIVSLDRIGLGPTGSP